MKPFCLKTGWMERFDESAGFHLKFGLRALQLILVFISPVLRHSVTIYFIDEITI